MGYRLVREIFIFLTGGFAYCILEVIFRGRSHISMLLAGGMAFYLIGHIYERNKDNVSVPIIMLAGMMVITLLEFIIGMVVNIYLNLGVWDYSKLPLNIKGQICPVFSACWFAASFIIIKLFPVIQGWIISKTSID